jgi:L-lactate utilization protein LutC
MTMARDSFLQRVRRAVFDGNRAGTSPVPARTHIGYQGAGANPVQRFQLELTNAGGISHIVPQRQAALAILQDLLPGAPQRQVLLGQGPLLDSLNLSSQLGNLGHEVMLIDTLSPQTARAAFFAADIGISGAEYLIAETGTIVMASQRSEPRSLSLLPPIHIVIAERRQLLPDLFDLFSVYDGQKLDGVLPSCLSLITGPSKTGDIELRLVTGVHGPGELHVILIDA